MSKKNLIVIGNGMVGHHFLEKLVATAAAADLNIVVFGEEKLLAYDRVHLSEYFSGSTHSDLAMGTAEWYAEHQIDLRLDEAVTDIDRDGAMQGPNLEATGALARLLTTPVIASGGVSSLEDLTAIKALESDGVAGAIVGRALYDGRVEPGAAARLLGAAA